MKNMVELFNDFLKENRVYTKYYNELKEFLNGTDKPEHINNVDEYFRFTSSGRYIKCAIDCDVYNSFWYRIDEEWKARCEKLKNTEDMSWQPFYFDGKRDSLYDGYADIDVPLIYKLLKGRLSKLGYNMLEARMVDNPDFCPDTRPAFKFLVDVKSGEILKDETLNDFLVEHNVNIIGGI